VKKGRRKPGLVVLEAAMALCALVYIYPIILVLYNSVKPFSEIMINVVTLPKKLALSNYAYVWRYINYPRLFLNNLTITVLGLAGIVFLSSIAAYALSRTKTRFSAFIYLFCIAPMLIPFQTIMITLLKLATLLGLANSDTGLAIQYWGFGAPLSVFIFHSFVKTIPRELDQSAFLDGASTARAFFSIIFPLLQPITATVIILNVMYLWNDFLLPLIMVNSSKMTMTLTLAIYTFMGQYTTDWQYAMATMVLAVGPSIIFFVMMQKKIVKSLASVALKG